MGIESKRHAKFFCFQHALSLTNFNLLLFFQQLVQSVLSNLESIFFLRICIRNTCTAVNSKHNIDSV